MKDDLSVSQKKCVGWLGSKIGKTTDEKKEEQNGKQERENEQEQKTKDWPRENEPGPIGDGSRENEPGLSQQRKTGDKKREKEDPGLGHPQKFWEPIGNEPEKFGSETPGRQSVFASGKVESSSPSLGLNRVETTAPRAAPRKNLFLLLPPWLSLQTWAR